MAQLYRFGIEEEYFLADRHTGHSPSKAAADRFHAAVEAAMPACSRELLVGQVEVQTEPMTSLDDAHADLLAKRRRLAELAEERGLSLLAAGSQPLAFEEDQHVTDKARYRRLASKVGAMAESVMVCAMHVHVEIPELDRRIDASSSGRYGTTRFAKSTSAYRQLAVFRDCERLGGEKALRAVTHHIAEETLL